MMRFLGHGVVLTAMFLLTPALDSAGEDKALTEKEKIEALIKRVETLKDATFIRNDKEYDAKTAAKFLRAKWDANKADVKTAKDFIAKVATASGTSGKAYLIRFKVGKEVKSADYLSAELKKLEKSEKSNS